MCGRAAAGLADAQQGAVLSEMRGLGCLKWKNCVRQAWPDQVVHPQLIEEIYEVAHMFMNSVRLCKVAHVLKSCTSVLLA